MKKASEIYSKMVPKLFDRSDSPEMKILCLPELNYLTHGLPKGEMIVIGARSSQGKSAFAVQMCSDLIKQDKKVLFLSLEMSEESIIERVVCNWLGINNMDLLKGKAFKYKEQLKDLHSSIDKWKLVVSEDVGRDWNQIDKLLSELTDQPDVIILDYIQNIKSNGISKDSLDDYLINFRKLCMQRNFCGLVLSQVNRASQDGKNKSPQLHHLKSTGNLEEAADKVFLLHYPYKTEKEKGINYFEIHVAKNRNGMTGLVRCKYQPQFYRFSHYEG